MAQSIGGKIEVIPENGQAMLPLGNYSVDYWEYERTDAQGTIWKIQGYPALPIQFEISNQPTSLEINPEPITAALTVGGKSAYSFSQALEGPNRERIYLYHDNERIPPKVEITNQAKNFSVTLAGTYG